MKEGGSKSEIHLSNFLKKKSVGFFDFFYSSDNKMWNQLLYSKEKSLDLSDFSYITSEGALWLAYIAAFRKDNLNSTYISLPTLKNEVSKGTKISESVVAYLKGIGFQNIVDGEYIHFTNFSDFQSCPAGYEYTRDEENELNKIIQVFGDLGKSKISNINRKIFNYVNNIAFTRYKNSNVTSIISNGLQIIITELIKNISEYGKNSDLFGIGCCSLIPPRRNEDNIRYCFLDIGSGFKKTLLEKKQNQEFYKLGEIKNDHEAIVKGLLYRQKIVQERIIGLYPVLGIICATHGGIGIRSGTSIVQINFSKNKNFSFFKRNFFRSMNERSPLIVDEVLNKIISSHTCSKIPGSQIYIDLNIKQRPDINFLEDVQNYLDTRILK